MFVRIKPTETRWWFSTVVHHGKILEVKGKSSDGLENKPCYDVYMTPHNCATFPGGHGTLIFISATEPIGNNNREAAKYYLKR